MLTYFCLKCAKTFEGQDPVVFREESVPLSFYPVCPSSWIENLPELTVEQVEAMTVEELKEHPRVKAYKKRRQEHPVEPYKSDVHQVKAAPKTVWGDPNKLKALKSTITKEEQDRINEEALRKKAEQDEKDREAALNAEASKLVNRLVGLIQSKSGKSSVYRPNDDLYDSFSAHVAVVERARTIWQATFPIDRNPHSLVGVKDDWRGGVTQCDFIVDNTRGGRHILHVDVK